MYCLYLKLLIIKVFIKNLIRSNNKSNYFFAHFCFKIEEISFIVAQVETTSSTIITFLSFTKFKYFSSKVKEFFKLSSLVFLSSFDCCLVFLTFFKVFFL